MPCFFILLVDAGAAERPAVPLSALDRLRLEYESYLREQRARL
jgi:hypothetical protein